jgi:hypothetical protein
MKANISSISSISAQIKFYSYKVNALCVVGIEAVALGNFIVANAVNKEALCLLDYCNSLREAKKLLKEDKKLKAEMSAFLCSMRKEVFYYTSDEEDCWFDSAPAKQEIDFEDTLVSHEDIKSDNLHRFRFKNSKNKSKWNRSGRNARVLSNR